MLDTGKSLHVKTILWGVCHSFLQRYGTKLLLFFSDSSALERCEVLMRCASCPWSSIKGINIAWLGWTVNKIKTFSNTSL